MLQRHIGPFPVSAIGLGCMNLSHAYGVPPMPEQGRAVLQAALDQGVTLFDTAALYGFGANERLVGPVLKAHRARITLCSKGGMTGQPTGAGGTLQRVIDGRPESLIRDCEASLQRLGTDVIDLYYLHRWDKAVPIEESMGALVRLKEAGKIRAIGLSEVSAPILRRAHAVHPVAALQTEYSLWSRNAEIAVLQACRELGVAFVAFSPVARGFLPGTLRDVGTLPDKDIRRAMPRFEPAHYADNLQLLDRAGGFVDLAREAGCTPAQLSLAWLLAQGDHVIPIPGTTSVEHLGENLGAVAVTLGPDLLARLDQLFQPAAIRGARYNAANAAEVDTETWA